MPTYEDGGLAAKGHSAAEPQPKRMEDGPSSPLVPFSAFFPLPSAFPLGRHKEKSEAKNLCASPLPVSVN